ncbi:uncharacterized protein M6B38_103055 [Iris pallida]|uniref:Uncharacterized protein n=1 Tax=Iris pallida TaxID=29817 RepID=A0AAX6G6L9_IRIPA|nr:uncharacterized protein M6B38_103055 [Iris pallida]
MEVAPVSTHQSESDPTASTCPIIAITSVIIETLLGSPCSDCLVFALHSFLKWPFLPHLKQGISDFGFFFLIEVSLTFRLSGFFFLLWKAACFSFGSLV